MPRTANEPQSNRKVRAALSPDLPDRAHRAGPELQGHTAGNGGLGLIGLRPESDALRRRDGHSGGRTHRDRRTPREALTLARDVLVTLGMLAVCTWLGATLGGAL